MDFIDISGHTFSLPSYDYKPIGYEYEENAYTFWIDSPNTPYLSINNYYMKPIYCAYIIDDFDTPLNERLNISISIDSNIFQLVSSYDIHKNISELKDISEYFDVSSSRKNELRSRAYKYLKPTGLQELYNGKIDDTYVAYEDKDEYEQNPLYNGWEVDESTGDYVLYSKEDEHDFQKYVDDIVVFKSTSTYGISAYENAKLGGYEGTEEEWLKSLCSERFVEGTAISPYIYNTLDELNKEYPNGDQLNAYIVNGDLYAWDYNEESENFEWTNVCKYINVIDYAIIPIYVIGYATDEGTWSTNVLIHIEDVIENTNSWCPITVGGSFIDNQEALIINGKNMGVNLPKDILRAVYQSSFYNDSFDEALFNKKMKEYMINYMNIKGECGNFRSAIDSLKWFGYGDKLSISKLFKTDNDFQYQYIHDYFTISYDMLKSFKDFYNTTLLALQLAYNHETGKIEEQDFKKSMFGEWKPILEEYKNKYIKVKAGYEYEQYDFWKPYYDFCFNELGLKIACLKYYYERYFLPLHLSIHSASITHKVYQNDIKLTNKVNIMKSAPLYNMMGDEDIVKFPDSKKIWFTQQKHYIDENFNEFNYHDIFIDFNDHIAKYKKFMSVVNIDLDNNEFDKYRQDLILSLSKFKSIRIYNINESDTYEEINNNDINEITLYDNANVYNCTIAISFNLKYYDEYDEIINIITDVFYNIYESYNAWYLEYFDILDNEDNPNETIISINSKWSDLVRSLKIIECNLYKNKIYIKHYIDIIERYKQFIDDIIKYDIIEYDHDIIYITINPDYKNELSVVQKKIAEYFNEHKKYYDQFNDDNIIINEIYTVIYNTILGCFYIPDLNIDNYTDKDDIKYISLLNDHINILEKFYYNKYLIDSTYKNLYLNTFKKLINKLTREKLNRYKYLFTKSEIKKMYEFELINYNIKVFDTLKELNLYDGKNINDIYFIKTCDIKTIHIEYDDTEEVLIEEDSVHQNVFIEYNDTYDNNSDYDHNIIIYDYRDDNYNINNYWNIYDFGDEANYNISRYTYTSLNSYYDHIDFLVKSLLKKCIIMNDLYYINDTCASIPIVFDNASGGHSGPFIYNCVLILENEYGEICFESKFNFIQTNDKFNDYDKFVIYPKLFNKDKNNKTRNINEWINHKFMLHLCVNNRWYEYEFMLCIPTIDIKLGTLEYKYYLNSDRYLLDNVITKHKDVTITDLLDDDGGALFSTNILSSIIDNNNEYDHSWEWLTNFCQLSDLSDDNIEFNTFMWHPKFAESNNILFGEYKNDPNTIYNLENKLGLKYYDYTTNIALSDKYLNLVHIFDIYVTDESRKILDIIPPNINEKINGVIYKTYLDENNELTLSLNGKYTLGDNSRNYIYRNVYNNEFSIYPESLYTLPDNELNNPHKIFTIIYKNYDDFKNNNINSIIYSKSYSDNIIKKLDITKLKVDLSNNITRPKKPSSLEENSDTYGETGRQWPINDHTNENMYYYEKDSHYIYPLKYKYKYVVKKNNKWMEADPTIYEFNFTSINEREDYNIQLDFYYNEYYILKHERVWEDELNDDELTTLSNMHIDLLTYESDYDSNYLTFNIKNENWNNKTIQSETLSSDICDIIVDTSQQYVFIKPKENIELNGTCKPKIYYCITEQQRLKYDIDKLEDNILNLKVGSKTYQYGKNSSINVINLYKKFFTKHYEVRVDNVLVKNIFDQLINIKNSDIDYDFYLMHDNDYWYGVFISKNTISNYINKQDMILSKEQSEFIFDEFTFKHINTSKNFLINRMRFVSSNGNNAFNKNDIIAATLYNNQRLPINPYIKNSKWNIEPITISDKLSDDFKSFTSNAEMVILTLPTDNNEYPKCYYNVNVKYCIDGDYNLQQSKTSKFKILG